MELNLVWHSGLPTTLHIVDHTGREWGQIRGRTIVDADWVSTGTITFKVREIVVHEKIPLKAKGLVP